MKLLRVLRPPPSAPLARERLQILLPEERAARGQRNLLAILRAEIIAAVAKHVGFEQRKVQVQVGRSGGVPVLEIEIEISTTTEWPAAGSRARSSDDRRPADVLALPVS